MQNSPLPQKNTSGKRQEKILAWTLTILLHILLIGGVLFWYITQRQNAPMSQAVTPSTQPVPQTVPTPADIPASAPISQAMNQAGEAEPTAAPALEAQIATLPASDTNSDNAEQNTNSPTANLILPNLNAIIPHPAFSASSQTANTIPVPNSQTQKNPETARGMAMQPQPSPSTKTTVTNKTQMAANGMPVSPTNPADNFPTNASTTSQSSSKTISTATGTTTTTTTTRVTTIAPEINQALTDRDIPAVERRAATQQKSPHLSSNAKTAAQLAAAIERDNQANSDLIESVKRKNQSQIDDQK